MTGLVVHQCPKCELRFSFRTELEHHLNVDHPTPATVRPTAAKVDEARARALPPSPPVAPSVAPARRGGTGWQARFAGLLLAIASVLLVAYAAVSVSISTAVVIAVVVFVSGGIYGRRARGRARLPRR
jgi:hypothetical protein